MLVLGIDPGIAITGYGLVTVDPEGNPALVAFGVINATAVSTNSSRLLFIYQHLHEIIADMLKHPRCPANASWSAQ